MALLSDDEENTSVSISFNRAPEESEETLVTDEEALNEEASDEEALNEEALNEEASDNGSEETVGTDKQRIADLLWSLSESDEEAVWESMGEIVDLCRGSNGDVNREKAFHLGAPLAVLAATKKHEESSQIQVMGYCALANIVYHQDEASETIATLGGIDIVLSAMTRFSDEVSLQGHACQLLANLAALQSVSAHIVEHPDGIPSIIEAMKKFPDHASLQGSGCLALRYLSSYGVQAHNDKIVQAGGLVALAAAKTKHPNKNEALWKHARKAITNLND